MNNSIHLDIEPELPDESIQVKLRQRAEKLVRMIEALVSLSGSPEWSTLKEELFDGVLETIDVQFRLEVQKAEVSLPALYRLQGQRHFAQTYAQPASLVAKWRAELDNIKKQLNPSGPTEL